MPPIVYVYGVLVKMIVIYTEAVQLCYSLKDTLSQMVHLVIISGLDCISIGTNALSWGFL